MKESRMNTGEMQRRVKPGPRKVNVRTGTALRLTREQYRRMRDRAEEEGTTFAGWLKRLAVRELRREI